MTRSARRGPWLPEEDQSLLQLVRSQGANNWVRISQQIQHRSPKQCRERYHQNLKPSLKHDPISAQEGEVIERLVHEMGKRWAEIARRLGNRSDNAVKNWWNGSVNRRRRNPTQTTGFKQMGSRLQPIPFTQSYTTVRPTLSGTNTEPPPFSLHKTTTFDPPPISPALSDTSQRQAPSLISDNQSMYSISPKTVTTPRPGIPAPVEIGNGSWNDLTSKPTFSYSSHETMYYKTSDPSLESRRSSSSQYRVGYNEDRSKDSRMNVSRLLD